MFAVATPSSSAFADITKVETRGHFVQTRMHLFGRFDYLYGNWPVAACFFYLCTHIHTHTPTHPHPHPHTHTPTPTHTHTHTHTPFLTCFTLTLPSSNATASLPFVTRQFSLMIFPNALSTLLSKGSALALRLR